MNKQCVNCPGRTDHDTADCKAFSPHSAETIQRLRETFEVQEKASGRSVELDESGDYIDPTVFFGWFGAVNGLSSSSSKHRPEPLAPAGSLDVANRASLPVGVPDGSRGFASIAKQCMDDEAATWAGDNKDAARLALDDAYMRILIALASPAAPTVKAEQVDDSGNIQHLTDCDVVGCERCENLMYFYQACDECGTWGHNDAGPCACQNKAPSLPAAGLADLTAVRCQCCAAEYPHDSYDAGFIAGSGMCQVCDAAMPPKDLPAAGSAVEEVEVVAWVNPSDLNLMSRYGYHSCTAKAVKVPCFTEPLMTVAQHKRIVAALSAQQSDPWAPSDADYDHAIHRNPDARAWADFFVATFPGQADKHDLMIGWFANAMMAMHDHLKAQQPEFCCEHSYKVAKQAAWGARDLTQCKCDHNEYCEHCWPDDFREGGKWYGGFEQQSAPERVSVPVELLERVCWPVVSGSDRHTHSEAVAELRALLASHAEGGKV